MGAPLERFELPTSRVETGGSNPLSYKGKLMLFTNLVYLSYTRNCARLFENTKNPTLDSLTILTVRQK